MTQPSLVSLTLPEARDLASALGACEHHSSGKEGGSLHEDADLVLKNYGKPTCTCSRLFSELTPAQAKEALALVLMGETCIPDESGKVVPDGTLDQFRQDAQKLSASHYFRRVHAGEFIIRALDYLEGHPFGLPQEDSPSKKDSCLDDDLEDL